MYCAFSLMWVAHRGLHCFRNVFIIIMIMELGRWAKGLCILTKCPEAHPFHSQQFWTIIFAICSLKQDLNFTIWCILEQPFITSEIFFFFNTSAMKLLMSFQVLSSFLRAGERALVNQTSTGAVLKAILRLFFATREKTCYLINDS